VVGIFDALNAKLKSAFFPDLFASAAEQRSVVSGSIHSA
jgi:hypothetical protein